MNNTRSLMALRTLQALIILAPLPFGAAPEPFATLFYLCLVLWLAVTWPDAYNQTNFPGSKWLTRLVMLVPALAALQLVPLPRDWVFALHPGAQTLLESLPRPIGEWLPLSLAPAVTFHSFLCLLVLALFFLTLWRLRLDRRQMAGIFAALLASGAVQTTIGTARMLLPGRNFFLFFYPIENPLPRMHLTGTFADNESVALFLATILLTSLGWWAAEAGIFSSRGPRSSSWREWLLPGRIRWVHLALTGICAAGFALTRSRNLGWLFLGTLFAALIMALYAQFTPQRRHPWRWALLAVVLLPMIMGVRHAQPRFQDRETGNLAYVRTVPVLKEMIKDFPVMGTGWGTFAQANPDYMNRPEVNVSHARNEWLQVAVEGGLVSLGVMLCALLLFLLGLWRCWIALADRWLRAVTAGLLAACMLAWEVALIHYPWRIPFTAFITLLLMALALRMVTIREGREGS